MIEAIFKVLMLRPMIWWRNTTLAREEFILILGLSLAPLLAVKDLLHPNKDIWSTAAVVITISVIGITLGGMLCSVLLHRSSTPTLQQTTAFGAVYVKIALFMGIIFFLQKMELTPEFWSTQASWIDDPTPFYNRVAYNLSCMAVPIVSIYLSGCRTLNKRISPLKIKKSNWVQSKIAGEKKALKTVLGLQVLVAFVLLELTLWLELPEWLVPVSG